MILIVLRTLKAEGNLVFDLAKSDFYAESLHLFGFHLNRNRRFPDFQHVEVIDQISPPASTRQLQSFLGSINPYHSFFENFHLTMKPLLTLLSNDKQGLTFNSPEVVAAFKEAKAWLKTEPILRSPDYSKPFYEFSDSAPTISAMVLAQLHPVAGKQIFFPIGYWSYRHTKREVGFSNAMRELVGAARGHKHFLPITYGHQCFILTDCQPNVWDIKSAPTVSELDKVKYLAMLINDGHATLLWTARTSHLLPIADAVTWAKHESAVKDALDWNLQRLGIAATALGAQKLEEGEEDEEGNLSIHIPTAPFMAFSPPNWRAHPPADPDLRTIIEAIESKPPATDRIHSIYPWSLHCKLDEF